MSLNRLFTTPTATESKYACDKTSSIILLISIHLNHPMMQNIMIYFLQTKNQNQKKRIRNVIRKNGS